MSVLLPTTALGVRRRTDGAVDAHGTPVAGALGPLEGPWPGRATEATDASWTLAVDPAAWPVRRWDVIVEPATGREWVAAVAKNIAHPLDSTVDWVRVEAAEMTPGGAEPGGAEFVGRS